MNAREYDEHYFGSVVQFDDVNNDKKAFAKVFSSGSSVLETLLLKLWERGIRTIACGNDRGWRLSSFSIEDEKQVQQKYYKFLYAKGIKRAYMQLNRWRWIPKHYGYISLQADSINNSEELVRNLLYEMKKYKADCNFSVKRFTVNGKRGLSFYFDIPRNKECIYPLMDNMTPEEIMKSTFPSPNAFDCYFKIFIGELERLYPVIEPLTDLKADNQNGVDLSVSNINSVGELYMENGFDRVGFMEYLENTFSGFDNSFLRGTVDNLIEYGLKNENVSLDQFCYWLSDILPEVEFKEVAFYMDDSRLTQHGIEEKREKEKEVDAELKEHPWLDDLISDAFKQQQSKVSAEKAQETLKNVLQHVNTPDEGR